MCIMFTNSNFTWDKNSSLPFNRIKSTRPIISEAFKTVYLLSFVFIVVIFFCGIFGRRFANLDDMRVYLTFKNYHKRVELNRKLSPKERQYHLQLQRLDSTTEI